MKPLHFPCSAFFSFLFRFTILTSVFMFLAAGMIPVRDASAAPNATTDDAPFSIGDAAISIIGLGSVPIGQDVSFSVSFDNVGTTAGYGPFIDLILDTTGVDGVYPGVAASDLYDGLGTSSIAASYLGGAIPAQDFFVIPITSATMSHPFALTSSGTPIQITGLTPGDTLVVVRLPFGSFSPTQPPAVVDFTVNMSNLADLGTTLTVQARGGFEFGELTPLNDWCCGDDAEQTLTPWSNGSVIPSLFTLSKSFSGPEDETATGPNFPRTYTVTATIAAGQTINNFQLTDVLPDNVQFVSMVSPAAGSCPTLPSTTTPGGTLTCNLGNASGTVSMTFNFHVPRLYDIPNPPDPDALFDDPVLNATTGDDGNSCNNASITGGTWAALDTRDAGGMNFSTSPHDPAGCENTFTPKSIAIQKGVTVIGGGDPAPGRVLQYTLNVQVSDFFIFDSIVATDLISDGQRFDTTFAPTIQVNGNGYTIATRNFLGANYTVNVSEIDTSDGPPPPPAENPATDGTTTVTFRISDEIDRTQVNGRMVGGCVDPVNGSPAPNCSTYNNAATTATIVFRTVIQESFSDNYPTGDWSVDQGDVLDDEVDISGIIRNTASPFTPTGSTEADDSAASVSIGRGTLVKSIYAINGSTTLPLNGSGQVIIKPSDTVTYRLTYNLATSDVENLYFEDYLPLPVFHVGDPDEDGAAGPAWTFDATVNASAPPSGVVKLGPTDSFYAYTAGDGTTGVLSPNTLHIAPATRAPKLFIDTGNNKLTVAYATYDDTRNLARTIDLLFTVTVSDDPFADNLYLTNQALAAEGSTFNSPASTTAIVQLVLTEPVLVHKKGVVATNNPDATFAPVPVGPVAFNAPGTAGARWLGTVDSPGLAANPIDSNITGVDAGDLVSFAIVIENQGSSAKGAFDLTILDTLPAMYQIPAGGLNLRISNGDNSSTFSFTRPDGSAAVPADLFSTGIEIVDPDPNNGACQSHTIGAGRNIIIITYDLEVRPDVTPGTQENTATLVNYAGSDNGPNHIPPTPPTDNASSTVLASLAKTLQGTEVVTANNSNNEVAIGELVTYRLTATVPEGSVPDASITDTLDAGLAFVSCTSVTASAGVTTNLPSGSDFSGVCNNNIVVTDAQHFRFNLGNITNANRVNNVDETITIEYVAVVLNVAGNQGGILLNNEARFYQDTATTPVQLGAAQNAPTVTVIEPTVTVAKAFTIPTPPATGDAGNPFTFTIMLTNTSGRDAFEVTLDDTIPALMTGVTLNTVTDTDSQVTLSNFSLVGNVLTTTTPFDFPADPTRSIVLTFSGTISYAANPGQAITNTAVARWSSMDGNITNRSAHSTNDDERTGTYPVVQPNDYTSTSAATFTVDSASSAKSIITTSEVHTPETGNGSNDTTEARPVTIGEIVRFRLVQPVPEGTSPNFQVRDLLPTGMTFIEGGTIQYGFVYDNVVTSSAVGTLPIPAVVTTGACQIADTSVAVACVLPDANIGDSGVTNADPDTYITSTDVYFKFGDLSNNDSDPSQEYVVIEFNALIDNSDPPPPYNNNAGNTTFNTSAVYVNGAQNGSISPAVYVRIVEPLLNPTKTALPASGDAGDVITYTLVFSNTGANASTAYEVTLTDTVPGKMTANLGSMTLVDDNGSGGSCATPATNTSAGNNINITYASVPVGCTVTATYTATLNATVTAAEVLANAVTLNYSSLPGIGTTPNATGSTTPGGSGTTYGERVRNDTVSANVTVTNFNPVKSIIATSEGSTGVGGTPAYEQLTIGETLTYRLVTDIPEGTQTDLRIVDILPAGFTYVGSPLVSFIADADITENADLAGADNDALPPTFAFPSYPSANGIGVQVEVIDLVTGQQRITFHLGNVVNNDSDVNLEQVVIDFTVRVNNDANANNTNLKNNDYSVWTDDSLGVQTNRRTSNTVTVRIVEPTLNVAKSANDSSWIYGQDITFTLNITHIAAPNSLANAFDIVVTDTIPASLTYVNLSITGPDLTWTTNAVYNAGPDTWTLTWTCTTANGCSLPLGSSAALTYHASVDTPPANGAMTGAATAVNNVDMTWTSLPNVDANERTGSGGVNDYNDSATHTGSLDYYALGNRVWFDTNNNSNINFTAESEQPVGTKIGVNGVAVLLYNTSGTQILVGADGILGTPDDGTNPVLTKNGGYYLFDNLPSGDYVVVIPATEFAVGRPLYGYWSSGTTLTNAGAITETTAALAETNIDSDDNGMLQTVGAYVGGVASSPVTLGALNEPTGEHQTIVGHTADVDALEAGAEHQGSNSDNRANMTIDFGFYQVGVGDIVWIDNVTVDGNYAVGETLQNGATVSLFAGNGTTQLAVASNGVWQRTNGVSNVMTGDAANAWAAGYYQFTGLPAGNYVIRVVGPVGSLSTVDSADTTTPNNNVNNNDNGIGTTSNSVASNPVALIPAAVGTAPNLVTYTSGTSFNPSMDFGFTNAYALGNRVWFDTDNDSQIDFPNESVDSSSIKIGVDGVTVDLYPADGSGNPIPGAPLRTTTTANGGYYLFDGLAPGDYVVVIPASNFTGGPLTGYWSSGTQRLNDGTLDETVAANADNNNDSDDNGTLQNSVDFGGAVISSMVRLGPVLADEPTSEHLTDVDASAPGAEHQGNAIDARANMTVDFGFYRVLVGDIVFMDANRNGLYDLGDAPIPNVDVELFSQGGASLGTTTTNASGVYQFAGQPDGNYYIRVVSPGGTISTVDNGHPTDNTTPNDNIDNNDNGIGEFSGDVDSAVFRLIPGAAQVSNIVDFTNGTTTNPTLDFGFVGNNSAITKAMTATDTGLVDFTAGTNVAIGEILTYEVLINLPAGTPLTNVTVTDVMDKGLAFVDCLLVEVAGVNQTITSCPPPPPSPPALPVVSAVTDPGDLPTNPANPGRQVLFTIGDILPQPAGRTIRIQYRAIVLDVMENQEGVDLNNSATWAFTGGSFTASAPTVEIVEPDLHIDKSAIPNNGVAIGTPVQFTLTISHTALSLTDAFDVVVTDILPPELEYIPCSITYTGLTPTDPPAIPAPYCPGTTSNLVFQWDHFPLNATATITFNARLVNSPATNTANVAWTSLPIDPLPPVPPQTIGLPQQLSVYNARSTERWYDPNDNVNVYANSAQVVINPPAAAASTDGEDEDLPDSLPDTGFAPNRVTLIPEQPADLAYRETDVWLEIPSLGLKLPIVGVPIAEEDWDLTWLWDEAGWLEGTAFPSWPGNSVLTGHVVLPNGQQGPFAELGKLRWGDKIIVHAFGGAYTYEVRTNRVVKPYSVGVLQHEEAPWLTLLTCKDYNEASDTYSNRIVVRAVMVGYDESKTNSGSNIR